MDLKTSERLRLKNVFLKMFFFNCFYYLGTKQLDIILLITRTIQYHSKRERKVMFLFCSVGKPRVSSV